MIPLEKQIKNLKTRINSLEKLESNVFFGDLNNVKEKVVYAGTGALNKPNKSNGFCITLIFNENYKKQIFYIVSTDNTSYERTLIDGIWGNWIQK